MRQTLTLSLPDITVKKVRAQVASGNYASTSEFFRDLIRHWEAGAVLHQIQENKKGAKPKKLLSFDEWR